MATLPYFVISPNTLLSVAGLIHGSDKTVPTPAEDWHDAKVDVVIPTHNEEENIVFCLTSLLRQTLKPRQIILVDDGSTDKTVEYAEEFCQQNGAELNVIRRASSIGKTPTIKRQAREFDSDVEFILDGDTVLESEDYIARTVEELYKGAGIASACGTVLSFRQKDRKALLKDGVFEKFLAVHPDAPVRPKKVWWRRFQMGFTSVYRDCLYTFLQRFVYRGQMAFFGSITHPVGCAVAYRRKYVKDLFDQYEPVMGDDLTNSEDIFIGFAFLNNGYRNIQLKDVTCRSQEPELQKLPHQFYMWSSSFLQSCYYFNSLTMSPFKALRRRRHMKEFEKSKEGQDILEKRHVKEEYRQPFGDEYTRKFGRPMGWTIFMACLEKIAFPTVLLMMIFAGWWEALAVTLIAETCFSLGILVVVAPKHQKLEFFWKGLLITPVRYSALLFDFTTIVRFLVDLWVSGNRKWRK